MYQPSILNSPAKEESRHIRKASPQNFGDPQDGLSPFAVLLTCYTQGLQGMIPHSFLPLFFSKLAVFSRASEGFLWIDGPKERMDMEGTPRLLALLNCRKRSHRNQAIGSWLTQLRTAIQPVRHFACHMVVVGKHFTFFAYCGLVGNPH